MPLAARRAARRPRAFSSARAVTQLSDTAGRHPFPDVAGGLQAVGEGAQGYLVKPFTFEALQEQIGRWIM